RFLGCPRIKEESDVAAIVPKPCPDEFTRAGFQQGHIDGGVLQQEAGAFLWGPDGREPASCADDDFSFTDAADMQTRAGPQRCQVCSGRAGGTADEGDYGNP